ncbi:alpha/beta hydrolase [Streptomyces sp. NA02950]|uniref:alpha/beta fold hydrolase n=1 Tax=Streptomyces sp. NA02950 TaxID=2742137 RepID=UPI0015902A3B|nr:alpha/beta hydrolase [Streptomyces sp. NA02950]QKV94284.1 alpha/beta hydrolase [Streptomyces sp. NA02950]
MKRVVLLHGLGNSGGIWSACAAHWRPDTEIHAPELPWSGAGITGWRHERDSARLLEEVLAAVPGGADLVVAHSFASMPLLELLGRRALAGDPLEVSGAVLVNPFYRPSADDFPWAVIAPLLESFPATMAEGVRLQSGDRPIDPELRADIAQRLCEFVGPYGWLRFLDAYLSTPLVPVHTIGTPCLVIGGGRDATVDVAEARALGAALPRGRARILPGGGHFPMLEGPGWFTGAVHDFLDGLARRARSDSGAYPVGT